MKKDDIKIITNGSKEIVYSVEIPETDEEFYNGLAYRKSVPEKTGMLYYYEEENPYISMFTPETEIPVDFIFLDICGNILKISRNAQPLSRKLHSCENAKAVLEINGGESDKYNIKEGDIVLYDKLYPPKNYAELTITNADEYFSLGKQLFANKDNRLYSYSFKSHTWFSKELLFDTTKYLQEINNVKKIVLTEEKIKKLLCEYEKDFRTDYSKCLKKYYVLKNDLLLSYNEIDDIYEMYMYGIGWKVIENFPKYIFNCFKWYANRITFSEIEKIISLNEKRDKEVNNKSNEDNLIMICKKEPNSEAIFSYSVIFDATIYKYNFSMLKCSTWKYGNEDNNWKDLVYDLDSALFCKCISNKQISRQEALDIINEYEEICKKDGKQSNIYFYDYNKYVPQFDTFENYTFSLKEWSAKYLSFYDDIKEELAKLNLIGRKIKSIKILGLDYSHREDIMESCIYDKKNKKYLDYKNIPGNLLLDRFVEIDEPILIEFEDYDVLELLAEQVPEFRISMNKIPWSTESRFNDNNIIASIMFSNCIEQKISNIEVKSYKVKDKKTNNIKQVVSNIIIRFENGEGFNISHNDFDYCLVENIDKNNKPIKASYKDLKEGFVNWTDIHYDKTIDFKATSSMFFLGDNCSRKIDTPYMILLVKDTKKNKEYESCISVGDFEALAWSFKIIINEFDEYDSYKFNKNKWYKIIDEAMKIVSFSNFDELFDYIINKGKENNFDAIELLNWSGKRLWDNKEKYKELLNDVKRWSDIVMKDKKTIEILGF